MIYNLLLSTALLLNINLYKITDTHASELSKPKDRQHLYYERYGNGGTRNYSAMSQRIEIEERYQPGNPTGASYRTPKVLIDNSDERISIYTSTPSQELLDMVVQGDHVWMYVFPQFFHHNQEDPYLQDLKTNFLEIKNMTVIPTSSSRTVLDVTSKAQIKMHCPFYISRFDRRLEKDTIKHCVAVTQELKNLLSSGLYPKFAILPDSIGVTFNGNGGWGYLVRESAPFPQVVDAGERTLIPMFALYGSDVLAPNEPLLITQMIDRAYKESGSNQEKKEFAKQFVLNEIILPLVDFFIVSYRETGILLELHGQNTLIELDNRGLPTRIVHRDLDNAIDADLRMEKKLGMNGFYPDQFISRVDTDKDFGSEQSIVFDKSIGRMNLDKLAEAMEIHYGIPRQELEHITQAHFGEKFPEFRNYFPKKLDCVYNYSSEMRPDQYNYYDIILIKDDHARWRPGN